MLFLVRLLPCAIQSPRPLPLASRCLHLPLLLFDWDVVLLDTFQSQVFVLYENLCRLSHEVLGQSQDLNGHGCREKGDLDVTRKELEDLLNLSFEPSIEQLVGLVKHENSKVV